MWRASAVASDKVGEVALVGGQPFVEARDPKAAYGHLMDRLVEVVTRDLRSA